MDNDQKILVEAITGSNHIQKDSKPYKKYILLMIFLCLVTLAGYVYSEYFRFPEVEISKAVQIKGSSQLASLEATGYVVVKREANISSQVAGVITSFNIEEGDHVEHNELIAQLDDSVIYEELRLAESNLFSSRKKIHEIRVRMNEAMLNLQRIKDMVKKAFASEAALDKATAELKALQARLKSSKSEVAVAERNYDLKKIQLEKYKIKAPFSGVVTSKHANEGEMIAPGSAGELITSGLLTLTDMDSREIEVDVNEAYIKRIFKNQIAEIRLDAYPEWPIHASVINYAPTADRQKATVKVRLNINELDDRILPDMGVRVKFFNKDYLQETDVAAKTYIPGLGLRKEQGSTFVWVVKNGVLEKVLVKVGERNGNKVEILEGIIVDDEVVISSDRRLAENNLVRVVNGK